MRCGVNRRWLRVLGGLEGREEKRADDMVVVPYTRSEFGFMSREMGTDESGRIIISVRLVGL